MARTAQSAPEVLADASRHWVLWDGDCGFCRRSANWVARRDRGGRLRMSAYQRAPAPPMTPALESACDRSVHVLTADGRTLTAGRASLFILSQVGLGGLARVLSWPPFIWCVEIGYWIVARNRKFFSRFMFKHETV